MNPDEPDRCPPPERLTDAERFALELRWYEGSMLPYVEWLLSFVEQRRDEIRLMAGNSQEPGTLVAATKRLIADCGSIHHRGESKDQMREIENELWYRGEKGNHDRARIQQEWTAAHAAAWRRWRIREYLFVADHCADRIAAVLLDQSREHGRSAQ